MLHTRTHKSRMAIMIKQLMPEYTSCVARVHSGLCSNCPHWIPSVVQELTEEMAERISTTIGQENNRRITGEYMSNFILDYSKKQTLQISNDAFYYLYYGEEPLDEDNLEEANEVSEMFSNNFYIEDDWKAVDDSDLIECTFVPYVEDQADYDEYKDLTKYIQQQIKWLDANHIRVWWFNSQTGTRELCGDFRVYVNEYGNKCFHTGNQDEEFKTGKMSLYFLKNFKKCVA